ncbi:MAG: hypothetical protein JXR40_04840 [Pontiellaceae bacterium]|nr:hypothetical protein [Pontiellaceae bacterium]
MSQRVTRAVLKRKTEPNNQKHPVRLTVTEGEFHITHDDVHRLIINSIATE